MFSKKSLGKIKKIALLHEYFNYVGGAEKVLLKFSEIFPSADIFFLSADKKLVKKYFPGKTVRTTFIDKLPFYKKSNMVKGIYSGLLTTAAESIDLRGYDLIISSCNSFIKGVISPEDSTHISYIHSPTRYIWDYKDQYLDEKNYKGIFRDLIHSKFSTLRRWDQIASKRPDILVANSTTTQKRIKKYYGRDSVVIYPPVEIENITPTKENEGYFLIISNLTTFKRVDLAVKVFSDLGENLVIIGDGPQKNYLKSIAKPNIDFLGFVSDDEKYEYLQNARAVITPTIEDFGIVPVEATAAGKPVIAINKCGTAETVINGKTGILFEDQTEESLMEAVVNFSEIEKDFDYLEIRKQAEKFSARKFEYEIKKLTEKN